MESLSEGYFDSDAAREIRKLKRGLILDLYLRRGSFWTLVSDMRARWNVTPIFGFPPTSLSAATPEDWPDPSDRSEEAGELRNRWWFAIDAIREGVFPAPYNDWQYFGLLWSEFISICIMYEPPDTELLSFAGRGGPHPYKKEPARPVPAPMLPAARQLRDWTTSSYAEMYYHRAIIEEAANRLEAEGIDLRSLIREVEAEVAPRLRAELHEYEEQHNPFRWYISVEDAEPKDVMKAYRSVRSRKKAGGRPPVDELTAVQCAILYDDHNGRSLEDGRFRHWTHKKLVAEFRRLGVKNERSAEEHVKRGRELRGKFRSP